MTDAERADVYSDAFQWFRLYPEFVPNPARYDEWHPAVMAANELFEAENAQAIEAQRAGTTEIGPVADESAVRVANAPKGSSS
jgi:hypothetical protein